MKPEIWGPCAWIFLHSITLNYPNIPDIKEKNNMKNFIYSLAEILPCIKCKNNFKSHLQRYPLDDNILNSRKNLVK